jgi:hypothetical protein
LICWGAASELRLRLICGGFKQNKDRALMEVVSVLKDSLTWARVSCMVSFSQLKNQRGLIVGTGKMFSCGHI